MYKYSRYECGPYKSEIRICSVQILTFRTCTLRVFTLSHCNQESYRYCIRDVSPSKNRSYISSKKKLSQIILKIISKIKRMVVQ